MKSLTLGLVLHFKHLILKTFFLSFKMSSVLTGFRDADGWMYSADGMIVGRARNDSYAEKVRAGLPAHVLVADPMPAPPVESCVIAPVMAAKPACAPRSGHDAEHCTDICCTDWWWEAGLGYDMAHGKYADWDFDRYFAPVESRSAARARRTRAAGGKQAAKPPKYGPKPTKKRTAADAAAVVAAPALPPAAEAVGDCALVAPATNPDTCGICGLNQDVGAYCFCVILDAHACHHCRPAFVAALAAAQEDARAYNAYLAELAAEIVAEIRAERRMRDARYRD